MSDWGYESGTPDPNAPENRPDGFREYRHSLVERVVFWVVIGPFVAAFVAIVVGGIFWLCVWLGWWAIFPLTWLAAVCYVSKDLPGPR
jgi:hypothetical protein